MLRTVTVILSLFYSATFFAQDTTMTFLNDDWKKTKQEKATYYKKSFIADGIWTAKFYPIDGTKKGVGLFNYFYENATVEKEVEYKKGKIDGNFISWYESGEKKATGHYVKNRLSGFWTTFYKNGNIDSEGNYVNKKKKGEWNFYFESGVRSAKENYVPGDENIVGTYWNEDGSLLETGESHQENPRFKSPYESFEEYVAMKVIYPEPAKDEGIEGTVTVNFLVNRYGEVLESVVVEGHSLLRAEAINVVKSSPTWVPGKKQNRPVDMWLTVEVQFSRQ
jgi:TonB family protein